MKPVCPKCSGSIPPEQINMKKAGAFCPACCDLSDITLLIGRREPVPVDISLPPKGVTLTCAPGGFVARAGCRSWWALFIIPFTLAWGGMCIGGLYGSQIAEAKFDPIRSTFGLPFLGGTILLCWYCGLTLAGSTVVKVEHGHGEASTGIGFLRIRRRFDATEVREVEYAESWENRNGTMYAAYIILVGERRVRVVLPPSAERSRAFFNLVRQELLKPQDLWR
jgi:hypothetical protein